MKRNADECQFAVAMDSIVGKWKPIIIYHLLHDSPLRFNELRKRLPNVTQRMLTLHLRELEEEEIVKRKIYPQIPPKVEYAITEYGKSLAPIIEALHQWGANHIKRKQLEEPNKDDAESD